MTGFWVICFGLAIAAYLLFLARTGADDPEAPPQIPLIALLVVAGAAVWRLAQDRQDDTDMIAALLVAGSALFGLAYNATLARREADRLRREKRADIRRALRAEIDTTVRELAGQDWPGRKQAARTAFAQDTSFVPFIVQQRRDRLMSILLPQIEVLDDDQIEKVTRYYALSDNLAALATDIRSDAYRGLDEKRRMALLFSYLEMEETMLAFGIDALMSLGDTGAASRFGETAQ